VTTRTPGARRPGPVQVRPVAAGDRQQLEQLCSRQSDDTLRRRFLVPRPVPGPELCAHLTDHDDRDRYAVVTTQGGTPIGIGRYDRREGTATATAWLLVDERAPSPEVDVLIVEELLAQARRHGIRLVTLEVHPLDHDLIEALDALPTRTARRLHCGIVAVQLSLD
jgi:hypothetical protein